MINKRFLGKGGIVDYQTSNTAYDKLAFIADNYPDMVKMYDTIMAHLKLPSNGGADTHLTKKFEDTYDFVQLDKEAFKGWGYDLDNPTDIQFLINGTFINKDSYSSTNRVYYIEYLDKFTMPTVEYKVMLSRGMDDFFEKMPTITTDWYVEFTVNGVTNKVNVYGYGDNTKDNFLRDLYGKSKSIDFSSPMTVKIYPYPQPTANKTFTYTSDTVENNPLYIVTHPAGFVTVNNVLVFPRDRRIAYNNGMILNMHNGTTNRLGSVTIYGGGEIISTYMSDSTGLTLKASSPITPYHVTTTDKYTFTHTIDSALRNN